MAKSPHFIGCDGGSTDPGPFPLGSGATAFPRAAIKRDLRLMLHAACAGAIPLFVGSAGTAGGKPHLELVKSIVLEIAAEDGLEFKLALIHAEQDKEGLAQRWEAGRISPLSPAPPADASTIRTAERVVGMMGPEPYLRALDDGAQVVIAGRSSDCAIFAGLPIRAGISPGVAWHAAKILECGAAAVEQRISPDCLFATCHQDYFDVEPLDERLRCTPQSVAAHGLYENSDPFRLIESTGTLDIEHARFEAIDDRRVRVSGSRFEPAERYTVKLEGATHAGYQSVLIGSVRDPYLIAQIDDWLARLRERLNERVQQVHAEALQPSDWRLDIRCYGRDGTLGAREPLTDSPAHELCLTFDVTAPTQALASSISAVLRHQALHLPIPQWSGLITTLACPYNPPYLERGPVYRFCLNHVIEPEDPYELFPIEHFTVKGGFVSE
jgi:ribosome modulation factor